MLDNVSELRPKAGDSEKITINLGFVDLGQIDLLVQEGFYANRTDLIRTAIRNQLDRHAEVVKASVARKSLDLGLRHYSRPTSRRRRRRARRSHPGARPGQHRPRRHARAGPRHDRFDRGAGRPARQPAVKAALADRIR